MQSIETMLRTVPGFAQLDSQSLQHVAAAGTLSEVAAGNVLFHEGTIPQALYVLLDGRVSLTGTAADASSTVIDILGPASSFVLANVLADEPYLMGAQAIVGSLLVRIAAEPMRQIVAAQPAAAMAMMRAMSAELGNMTRQVADLKVRVAAQRLGTYLLSQVKEPAATKADFRLPVTKGLLAPWLGCRAENLSRAFMALRAYGVETHGSRVLLHDVASLRAYAGAGDPASANGAAAPPPVEKVFGDAFRLRPRRSRGT
ncbi:MAG: cyclic nucleotide-binding domain-containing protein [Acetobacteraceae bacterium]